MSATIKIYVPHSEVQKINENVQPSEFWLSKPPTWSDHELAELTIPLETYNKWANNGQDGKIMLWD